MSEGQVDTNLSREISPDFHDVQIAYQALSAQLQYWKRNPPDYRGPNDPGKAPLMHADIKQRLSNIAGLVRWAVHPSTNASVLTADPLRNDIGYRYYFGNPDLEPEAEKIKIVSQKRRYLTGPNKIVEERLPLENNWACNEKLVQGFAKGLIRFIPSRDAGVILNSG